MSATATATTTVPVPVPVPVPAATESKPSARRDQLLSIERSVQSKWAAAHIWESDAGDPNTRLPTDKYFATFPYPYMNGVLHLGHGFTMMKADFQCQYQRLKGKNVLWPFAFHVTGMPIAACADRLKREIAVYGNPPIFPAEEETVTAVSTDAASPANSTAVTDPADDTDTTDADGTDEKESKSADAATAPVKKRRAKAKIAKKASKQRYQWEILREMGVPESEIASFADSRTWLNYFPPIAKQHLDRFGLSVDWRRAFITTSINPYYDSFIRWQFNTLKRKEKVAFGKRLCVFSPIDNQACLPAGTQVMVGCGRAVPIESIISPGTTVLSCEIENSSSSGAIKSKLVIDSVSTGAVNQNDRGIRNDLVRIRLGDGSELICTADHFINTAGRGYVRADQLISGDNHALNRVNNGKFAANSADDSDVLLYGINSIQPDEVLLGPIAVGDDGELSDWILNVNSIQPLAFNTPAARQRSLAFARIAGFVLADGWILHDRAQGGAKIGQIMDVDEFQADVKLVCGRISSAQFQEQMIDGSLHRCWSVRLPAELARAIASLEGWVAGKRMDQPPSWPAVAFSATTPLEFVREFIAGHMGGDGHTPNLHNFTDQNRIADRLHAVELSGTVLRSNENVFNAIYTQIAIQLGRLGVNRSFINTSDSDDDDKIVVHLVIQAGLEFAELIGFRYCWYKQVKLSMAASYWRFCENVIKQRTIGYRLILDEVKSVIEDFENSISRTYSMAMKRLKFKLAESDVSSSADSVVYRPPASWIPGAVVQVLGESCRLASKSNERGYRNVIRISDGLMLCPHSWPGGCCSCNVNKWTLGKNLARHSAAISAHPSCTASCPGFAQLNKSAEKRMRIDTNSTASITAPIGLLHRQSQLSLTQFQHKIVDCMNKSAKVESYNEAGINMDSKFRKLDRVAGIRYSVEIENELKIRDYVAGLSMDSITAEFCNWNIACYVPVESYFEAIGAAEIFRNKYAGITQHQRELPTYHLPVISVEKLAESKNVYDLSVIKNPSFVANSVVVHNCADHDRASGEGVGITDYTLIKLLLLQPYPASIQSLIDTGKITSNQSIYLPAATLRPETMYGQTNAWLLPDGEYGIYNQSDSSIFICSEKSALNMSYQELTRSRGVTELISTIKGQELLGYPVKAPLSQYDKVYILPLTTIKMDKGTGVVTSVPSDAPDDYAALMDLKKKPAFREKYSIPDSAVLPFDIVPIINTPGLGNQPAVDLCIEAKIQSQNDRIKLDLIKDRVYKEGFAKGIMLVGPHTGTLVSVAKPLIKSELIAAGLAAAYSEPESRVVSRSGNDCVVAYADQWYLKYGEFEWQSIVRNHIESKLECYNPQSKIDFLTTINWLHEWALSRSYGLGTLVPWDQQFVIESLSDSTIYMAYYTIAHFLQQGSLNGEKSGTKNIKPELLNDQVYNYIFLEKEFPNYPIDCGIPQSILDDCRREFNYWYPMDLRVSGKDLIKNHLTMSLYNHAAIWPNSADDKWPQSLFTNGHVLVDSKKMSKSEGNFITIIDAVNEFSADATRFSLADAGDGLEDANFEKKNANAAILKLTKEEGWIKDEILPSINSFRTGELEFSDRVFANELNRAIINADIAYSRLQYRDALKAAFHDLQTARDIYRFTVETLHRDLINRYLSVSALLLMPICPHFTQHLWEITGNSTVEQPFIVKASWPKADPIDLTLDRQVSYLRDAVAIVKKSYADTVAKLTKAKAKSAPAASTTAAAPISDSIDSVNIYVSAEYPAWQQKVLSIIKELDQKAQSTTAASAVTTVLTTAGRVPIDRKDLVLAVKSSFGSDKKQFESATKFGTEVLLDLNSRGTVAYELNLPFNEQQLIQSQSIIRDIPITQIQVIAAESITESNTTDQSLLSTAKKSLPGRPSAYFFKRQ